MALPEYHLKENPFRIGPPLNPEEIVWAGFSDLKEKIENRIKSSIQLTPSRIVLNWGRYGSGKTHAANYYTRTKRIDEICADLGAKPFKSIKLSLPRTSKDPVQAFFRNFLGQISLKDIKADFTKLLEDPTVPEIISLIESVSSDSVITEVFKLIVAKADNQEEQFTKLEAYLFGDTTKGTLLNLGLPAGLKDDEQIVNFLSTYISSITASKKVYSGLSIWLDEFEDIDTLSKASQDRFTTFLRQLFDKSPNNFTLFLNFTPKTFFNVEDLSITLGEALATRAKLQIVFEEPKLSEAKVYIFELLNNPLFREGIRDWSPFTEESVTLILEHIGRLSIRKINEVFSLLIELGQINKGLVIDETFVRLKKEEIISWEE
jgi:hypothetical protein